MGFKEKVLFVSGCWSCLIGLIILGILFGGQNWQEAQGNITAQYGVMPPRTIVSNISIYIGLQDVTVELKGYLQGEHTEIDTKEVFSWRHDYMKNHLKHSLRSGLPYPILTVLEYLNEDNGWGSKFCLIGRLTSAGLWISLAIGLLSTIFFHLGEKSLFSASLCVTGLIMITSTLIYELNFLSSPLIIHISGQALSLSRGWPYYVTLGIGIVCLLVSILAILVLTVENLESPIQFFSKIYFKLSLLFRKHAPHLQAIT